MRHQRRCPRTIIRDYTREAGVRNLEREIGNVFRHVAAHIAEALATVVSIVVGDLTGILGAPRFESELGCATSIPGVATGLAWTPVGGEILFVEATVCRERAPDPHRAARRCDEGKRAGGALSGRALAPFGIEPDVLDQSTFTSTCPRARSPRTAPAPVWPCHRRWCRY